MRRAALYDYVVVGGGVAAVTAAEEIRTRDPHASILVLSEEQEPLYSRVLLPHYVRGRIDRKQVFLRTFEQFAPKRIEVWSGEHAIACNLETREITTSLDKLIKYEKLLIATGGTPRPWAGVDQSAAENVYRLQTLADADRLHDRLHISKAKKEKPVVVGGGFIALEFVESAVHAGLEPELLLSEEKFFGSMLDDAGWELVQKNFAAHHVNIHAESDVARVMGAEQGVSVTTRKGETYSGDWVGVGIGIERNLAPFKGIGLDIERGIRVNQYLQSSIPTVWAAGDIAEYVDVVFDKYRIVGNWTNAVMQGKVAGANMAGAQMEFRAVSTYSITSLGWHLTFVGETALTEGMDDLIRIWPEHNGYERLFFAGDVLKGAILINQFKHKTAFSALIGSGRHLGAVKDQLKDPTIDVAALL